VCVCVCLSLSLSLSFFNAWTTTILKHLIHLKAHKLYHDYYKILMKNLGSLNSWSVIRVVCYLLFVGACVAPEFVGPASVSVLSFRLDWENLLWEMCVFCFCLGVCEFFLSMNLGFRI
jgi:hypothetical protein